MTERDHKVLGIASAIGGIRSLACCVTLNLWGSFASEGVFMETRAGSGPVSALSYVRRRRGS
jgi:hypothetical protein